MSYKKPDLGTFASTFSSKHIAFESESALVESDNVHDALHQLISFIKEMGTDTAISLIDEQILEIENGTTRKTITTLGKTGTIGLPLAPGPNMIVNVKTAVEPTNIIVDPRGRDIDFLDGTTSNAISLRGHYNLYLYWNGAKYIEVQ